MKKRGIKSKKNNAGNNTKSAPNLSFEEFARFFEKLSDDVVNDMLVGAHLLSPAQIEAILKEDDYRTRRSRSTKVLIVIIILEIFLLPLAMNKIYMSTSINDDNPITYSSDNDEVFCDDGRLKVNNVNVAVPVSGNEEYNISYAWASEDTDYPSVPRSANVIYYAKDASEKYEIALYRNDFTDNKSVPKGKTVDNWFSEWGAENDDDNVVQEQLKTGTVNGFYIYPKIDKEHEENTDYGNYSFYFATKDDSGISTYVLEGNCLNKEAALEFSKIMDVAIKSISLDKKPAKKTDNKTDEKNDASNEQG